MTIVAHQDDDILFMNPDIFRSIEAGEANTTVYVTAGDAGYGRSYWEGREAGAKAAYAEMTGLDLWVDETLSVSAGDTTFSITSSYLAEDPDIRLYFLRLPDGAGDLAPDQTQQLARLESGDLATVTAVDGSATYGRADLVNILTGLMELHTPQAFRMQVHEGDTAAAEHTDHRHTAEFAEEALTAYDGGTVSVTHYVHYDSRLMPENLSPEDAGRSLAIMQAYAEHDVATTDGEGRLLDVYLTWTGRQYVDEQYTLDTNTDGSDAPELDPDWPGPGDWAFSLSGPDAFLFQISAATGAVIPKDWFVPSLDDAWDQDEDHLYEVTRTAVSSVGGDAVTQSLVFETTGEGELTLLAADGGGDPIDETTGDDTITETGDTETETGGGDTGSSTGNADTVDGSNDEDTTSSGTDFADGIVFTLGGEDSILFVIDAKSGAIEPQGWFYPDADDAWDRNEDHVYELVRVGTAPDGTVTEETIRLHNTEPGVLEPIAGDTGDETTDDSGSDSATSGTDDDATGSSGGDEVTTDIGGGGSSAGAGSGVIYSLGGQDAFLFVIDADTGAIDLQGWFTPDPDDAWDRNEDHVYEITRMATPTDGRAASVEEIRYQTLDDGSFVEISEGEALMEFLGAPAPGTEAEVMLLDEMEVLDTMDDAL